MKKIKLLSPIIVLAAAGTVVVPILSSCACGSDNPQDIKTVKLIEPDRDIYKAIDWPSTISSADGSNITLKIQSNLEKAGSIWNNFVFKVGGQEEKNGRTVGYAPNVFTDKYTPVTFTATIDWSKVNDGDTIWVQSYDMPMWARIYNENVNLHPEKLLQKPAYVYAGDNAKLFGKNISYGILKQHDYTNVFNVEFENASIPSCYPYLEHPAALMMAMVLHTMMLEFFAMDGSSSAVDGWWSKIIMGYSLIPDVQGDDYSITIRTPYGETMGELVLNANGRLTSFDLYEKFYSATAVDGDMTTSLHPVYYMEGEAPIVEIDDGVTVENKMYAKVANLVAKEGAETITVNDIYATDGATHNGSLILKNSSGDTLATLTNIRVKPLLTPDKPIKNTNIFELNDAAKAAIAAETGHLKIVFEETV